MHLGPIFSTEALKTEERNKDFWRGIDVFDDPSFFFGLFGICPETFFSSLLKVNSETSLRNREKLATSAQWDIGRYDRVTHSFLHCKYLHCQGQNVNE